LLFVPLDQAKLTPMGRQRLKPDTGPWLRVFGKIETYDDGTLTILPIVVSSA